MSQIYHVYLNNSNDNTSEFINSVEAASANEAIDKTKSKLKIKIGGNSPLTLSARSLEADINAALGGSSSQTIDTNININQSGDSGETNSCALNAILANVSSAISKKEELEDCTIDINKLILCLSENLEKQKLPPSFNRELQQTNDFIYPNATNLSAEDRIKADRASKFLKLYLAFKYNLFPTIQVPLKPKDANNNSQTVLDFEVSNSGAQQNKLNNLQKALKARAEQLLRNRNKTKSEFQTLVEDPQWRNLATQIQDLEQEIANSTRCVYDNCSVSVNIRPKFIDRIKNSSSNKINRFTISHSSIFVEIAKIIASGNSVPLFIRVNPDYLNTLNGPDVNTIIIDNFTGSNNSNLHIVSIIGISTENSDGGITLTIQDSYNTSGSNNRNIFKIKLPKSYFKSEIENFRPDSQYNLGFQQGLISNSNQLFVGVDVDVVPQNAYCCEAEASVQVTFNLTPINPQAGGISADFNYYLSQINNSYSIPVTVFDDIISGTLSIENTVNDQTYTTTVSYYANSTSYIIGIVLAGQNFINGTQTVFSSSFTSLKSNSTSISLSTSINFAGWLYAYIATGDPENPTTYYVTGSVNV
jgi:hypothetical protein